MFRKILLAVVTLLVVTLLAVTVILLLPVVRSQAPMEYEEALACVQKNFPAASYATNEYLPDPSWAPGTYSETTHLKVGMPWIMNDEEAQFYNAIEKGFYQQVGLEVELIPGGPGIDHVQTLGGGAIDIAISAGAKYIPKAVASTTPINVVAVGTLLKGMPFCFITVDPALLDRKITPQDLRGTTIALQPTAEDYLYVLLDKNGIPRDSVEVIDGGFTPDAILVGKAKFYSAWIMNQPRLVEEKGFRWNALMFRDWAFNEFADVVTVRHDTLETEAGRDLVRRFLWATVQGTQYLLDHPEESADIAAPWTKDVQLTKEQMLWRFAHQKDLVVGNDNKGLLWMDPELWDEMVATMVQYDQIEVPCSK